MNKKSVNGLIVMGILSTSISSCTPSMPKPPMAKKVPHVTEINGRKLSDDYYWLREKTSPEVKAYLEAENAYTDAIMKPTEVLQKKLYDEMLSRIKETDVDVPYKEGAYWYYDRTEKGKQYPIYCRKKDNLGAPEETLLDVNTLAQGKAFFSVSRLTVSLDGNLLAYRYDDTGYRQYKLAIKDLRSGKSLVDQAERVGSLVWANDNKTLFYSQEDATSKRQHQLYRHLVGTKGQSTLVYEEKDERFSVSVGKTRNDAYIFLMLGSHTASEARYLKADKPDAEFILLKARQENIEYYPDQDGNDFYVRTNDKGRNFRLIKMPVSKPDFAGAQEVIAHRSDVMLEDVDFFKTFYVVQERERGLPQIRVVDLKSGASNTVSFPEPAYDAGPYVNRVYDTNEYRYTYDSLITPRSVFAYDITKRASTLLKQKEVPGGYDKSRYVVERLFADGSDGVKIPISLLRKKDSVLDGKGGLYLNGYGSYGYSFDAGFSSNIFSLVDRGVTFAIAHIRGGGEMGKAWHDAGRMFNKKNTFTDFIASAEFLLGKGYGAKDRLVIEGGSAGGLLMGAVLNMRPDLFKAAIVKVPFVDVINTMLDESLPLTVGEFEEWGNPKEKAAFEYMLSYSPYDNIEAKAYPDMLVKTSFNDSQVMYWEPAKYVAKMRETRTDKNVLMFKTNLEAAGHGGASGRYDKLKEAAFDFAYILNEMKL